MSEEPAERSYHHGNLRQVLIDTALAMANESGGFDFTFRELSRRAKVTHNAPYRHFAGRAELLEALREEGLARLAVAGQRALTKAAEADGRARVKALGDAYVRFAEQEPVFFRLVMSPPLDLAVLRGKAPPESYRLLVDTIAQAQQLGEVRDDMEAKELALAAWSLVHGLASLLGNGRLPGGEQRLRSYSELLAIVFFEGAGVTPKTKGR